MQHLYVMMVMTTLAMTLGAGVSTAVDGGCCEGRLRGEREREHASCRQQSLADKSLHLLIALTRR